MMPKVIFVLFLVLACLLPSAVASERSECEERCFQLEVTPVCGVGLQVSFENGCMAECAGVIDYEVGSCVDEIELSAFNGEPPEEEMEEEITKVEYPRDMVPSEEFDPSDPAESYPAKQMGPRPRPKEKRPGSTRSAKQEDVFARISNANQRSSDKIELIPAQQGLEKDTTTELIPAPQGLAKGLREGSQGGHSRKLGGEQNERSLEDAAGGHARELKLTGSEMDTLLATYQAIRNSDLEFGLDMLATTAVTGLCLAAGWAIAGAQVAAAGPVGVWAGASTIQLAGLLCTTVVAFVAGAIFSAFSWIGNPEYDDAWFTVAAAKSNYADGNSLAIKYHRSGEVDSDTLGWIDRDEVKTTREDLDSKHLRMIEVYVHDTNDVCVEYFGFTVGREPSGTGEKEEIVITAGAISYITEQAPHNQEGTCLYFGDAETAIGNFRFHWPSALKCSQNFGDYLSRDYIYCLTWAMYSYDKRINGQYRRWTYSSSPSLPSHYANPMRQIKSRKNTGICFDVDGYRTNNFNQVHLVTCRGNNAQLFDFDSEGRLRSTLDHTKCIEAGKAGHLYNKLYVYDCHNGDWQRWKRYSSGRIKNVYHGKYIGISYCNAAHLQKLELRWYEDGNCGETQKWYW